LWLAFVTDVDRATARTLIDSMTSEVVVHDTSIRDVVPGQTMGYDDAVRLALAERKREERARGERGRAEHGQHGDHGEHHEHDAHGGHDAQGGKPVGSAERHDSGR
jgi:hypothetical protein